MPMMTPVVISTSETLRRRFRHPASDRTRRQMTPKWRKKLRSVWPFLNSNILEVRDSEFAKFPEIGCEQQGEQDIPSCPAHQVKRAVSAKKGNQPGHGNKRGCRHPVCSGCHAVGQWRYTAACDVEITGRAARDQTAMLYTDRMSERQK